MLLAILMLLTSTPLMAFATDESGVKPSPETTVDQPFISGKPSIMYRIPNLVSLDDGTLVAGADASWDGGNDGGGTDSMIAVSKDNGDNWSNQFTTYYPDNGNRFDKSSTGVCDTEMATDGQVIYTLTQFFPAGYAIGSASANNVLKQNNGTAFFTKDEYEGRLEGRLKLFLIGQSGSFNYYLGDFNSEGADGRAVIYNVDGTATDYTADHEYYLYYKGNKQDGNLFYSDGLYQTAKVNFLLFRKSTDGGQTWSAFTPLNVKNASEAFYGVGPGRGLVVDYNGGRRIIFSCYCWYNGDASQRSSFIYSDDGGVTWTRTADFPELPRYAGSGSKTIWSSENALVQMDSKTIRCFVRNGWGKLIYADALLQADGSYQWTDYTDCQFIMNGGEPGVFSTNTGCQLSAIKYSKKLLYNGRYYTAVLISTPTAKRAAGKIYTLLFDEFNNPVNVNNKNQQNNKSIEYTITTNGGFFAYSCMTELPDGRVAILYESLSSPYAALTFKILDPITRITGLKVENTPKEYDLELIKGDVKTYLVDTDQVTNSNPETIQLSFDSRVGTKAHQGDDASYSGRELWLKEALYDFVKNNDGSWTIGNMGIYLTIVNPGLPSSATKDSVKIYQQGEQFLFVDSRGEALAYHRNDDSGKKYQFDQSTAFGNGYPGSTGDTHNSLCLFDVFRIARANETSSSEVPGYVRITSLDDIKSGEQYVIGCKVDSSYYFIYPSTSTNNTYSHSIKADTTPYDAGYIMNVTALKKGTSKVVAGIETFNFNVSDYSREILGVVDYDPVIYTHGTSSAGMDDMNITFIGNNIADATYEGEKKTEYRYRTLEDGTDLSTQYKITKIETLDGDGANAVSSDITFDNGMLHGKLDLANTSDYFPYNKVTYVTLKTYIEEIATSTVYIQTDRLCVASNPVPGHILSGRNAQTGSASIQLATFVIAPGSYGNTLNLKAQSGANYVYNAKHLFNYGDTYGDEHSICYKNTIDDIRQLGHEKAEKIAGILENGTTGNSTGSNTISYVVSDNKVNDTVVAYYYYDKSSPKNEGITVDPNDPSNFSLLMSRQSVNVEYTKSDGDVWNKDAILDDNTGKNIFIKKHSGSGSITEQGTNAFGTSSKSDLSADAYTYTVGSAAQSKDVVVQCSTKENGTEMVAPNSTTSLKGLVSLVEKAVAQRGGVIKYTAQGINYIRLPFEIKMCDKSEQRDAYNETIKNVLKSTDFTTTSWKNYMDSALVYQEYLNNYTILTPEDKNSDGVTYQTLFDSQATDKDANPLKDENGADVTGVDKRYNVIQKSAQFEILEKELESKAELYENGIDLPDGKNYTPDSFESFEAAYEAGNTFMDSDPVYKDEDARKDVAGWEVGPTSEEKLPIQNEIEDNANAIANSNLQVAGDATAYEAVRSLSRKIDRTAYTNNGENIDNEFDTHDKEIYKQYNYRRYVNIPETEQSKIDDCITQTLTEMSIANKSSSETSTLRKYNIKVTVNGAEIINSNYNYGEIANLDFSEYMTEENSVKCVASTYKDGVKVYDTTVNLDDYKGFNYVVPIVIQNDMLFDLSVQPTQDTNQITVKDYFGTVIGVLFGDSVTVSGTTVTVGDVTVNVKSSPKYEFTGWSVEDGTYPVENAMTIIQRGTLNSSVHVITAENGTVNGRNEFASNYLNLKLTLESPNAKYWTRTVNGNETLASYDSSFVNFSSDEDVTYKAYNSLEALPSQIQQRISEDIPAVYGTGYAVNGKFTMSCDYSGSENVKILDAGVIYSKSDLGMDGLVKGGLGAYTIAANRIAHWSTDASKLANSGTFTMSMSKGIETGAHYMRAYVSYTVKYKDYELPFVAYSNVIYKYENGTVTVVE